MEESPTKDIKPLKKHAKKRIDGIVAMVMAKGIASAGATSAFCTSVYEERGALVV